MGNMMDLNDLGDLLSGGDRVLDGIQTTSDDACGLAGQKFPGKPYCLVEDWVLIDLTPSPSQLKAFKAKSFSPTFLYAARDLGQQGAVSLRQLGAQHV
ncbi:hypothetical protein HUT29_30160 [Pseudomonas chlororaphis]|jgi:hypothetical protein|nr:hypothetical protein [Pseudomonas chlororaphis]QTT85366.1 hypothetical protein HUT29_30160 [Pseudomonas chlororaphis]